MSISINDIAEFVNKITAIPVKLLMLEYTPEAFGSWLIVLKLNEKLFRLIYDGRESSFILEESSDRKSPGSGWKERWTSAMSLAWQDKVIDILKS